MNDGNAYRVARYLQTVLPGHQPHEYVKAAKDLAPLLASVWAAGRHGDRNPYEERKRP